MYFFRNHLFGKSTTNKRPRVQRILVLFLSFSLFSPSLFANNPPTGLGTWRIHLPYRNVKVIEDAGDKIYCAAEGGMFTYDKSDGSTERLSPINGFSGYSVQDLAYHRESGTLLIAYTDGKIEIIRDKNITRNEDVYNKNIIGSKIIYDIQIENDLAYFSTSFGLLEFDFIKNEFRNSYLNIGPGGSRINIYSSCFYNDSIFIATEKGVLKGRNHFSVNLGNFANWYPSSSSTHGSKHIAAFNGKLYAENDSQLLQYSNGNWSNFEPGTGLIVSNISVYNNELLCGIYGKHIIRLDQNGSKTYTSVNVLNSCIIDSKGDLYYASPINGLAQITGSSENYFYPNGPRFVGGYQIIYAYDQMWLTAGAFTSSTYAPVFNGFRYDFFDNTVWDYNKGNLTIDTLHDFTVAHFQKATGKMFIGTHGKGLVQFNNKVPFKVYDEGNSPLKKRGDVYNIISGIASDNRNNVWVSNFDVDSSLHMLNTSGNWFSYKMPSKNCGKIVVDTRNNKWILTPRDGARIIALNDNNTPTPIDDVIVVLDDNKGSGSIPGSEINDIAFTKSGELLIGTDQGYVKIRTPSAVFNSNVNNGDYDAQRVIVSVEENSNLGGYLLGSEIINCIVVDGGDRRWFGTNRGAWLYDSDGETLLKHFTIDNSPLMSNEVKSIGIDEKTGEVYFITDRGVCSYSSDATPASKTLGKPVIYPNPVRPGFTGEIAINGLQDNTLVKITDIAGNLVYQTFSNGGTASWGGQLFDGNRAVSGIYLVFCINNDGTETSVGKILFLE